MKMRLLAGGAPRTPGMLRRFGALSAILLASACGQEGAVGAGEAAESLTVAQLESELNSLPAETEVSRAVAAAGPTCDAVCNAKSWIGEERYAEAREALVRHLATAPSDADAALLLTSADIADEEFGRAHQLASAWLEENHDVRMIEQRARASLLGEDVETAVEDLRELISELKDQEPDASICDALTGACATPVRVEAHAWVGLATAEYNRQNLEVAEQLADTVIDPKAEAGHLDPAHGQFLRALIASQRGDDAAAETLYRDILARFPNEPGSLINIGGIHFRSGDLAAARRFQMAGFEAAGTDRRSAAIAWSNVAEIDMLEGKVEDAEAKYLEALETSKGFAGAHFGLAVLYDLAGRTDEAKRQMVLGLKLDDQGVTRWNTSWYTPEHQQHFELLVAVAQGDTDTAAQLARALSQASDAGIATAASRWAKATGPGRS